MKPGISTCEMAYHTLLAMFYSFSAFLSQIAGDTRKDFFLPDFYPWFTFGQSAMVSTTVCLPLKLLLL